MPRHSTQQIALLELEEKSKYFTDKKWEVVEKVSLPIPKENAMLKHRKFPGENLYLQLQNFINKEIWDILIEVVESKLYLFKSCRNVTTNAKELQELYAVQILVENTFSNETRNLKSHFKMLKETYSFKMTYNRFSMLKGCISPSDKDILEICQILHNNFMAMIMNVS